MKPLDARRLAEVMAELGAHQGAAAEIGLARLQGPLTNASDIRRCLQPVLNLASEYGLVRSRTHIEGLIAQSENAEAILVSQLATACQETSHFVAVDLASMPCLRLEGHEPEFFEQNPLGDVAASFKGAADYDAFEAGSCYATGRYTATVFHAMRVLEVGLAVLKRKARVQCDPMWKNILREVRVRLQDNERRRNNLKSWRGQKRKGQQQVGPTPKAPFWTLKTEACMWRVVETLEAFKDAYRNRTSHQPDVRYTMGEAKDVLDSVVKFMTRLAASGLPSRRAVP